MGKENNHRPKKYTQYVCSHKIVFNCGDDIYIFLKESTQDTTITISEYIRTLIYNDIAMRKYLKNKLEKFI